MRNKTWVIAGLIVICGGVAAYFLWSTGPGFSDAPEAAHVALSQEGGVADVHYATCRRSETPKLQVWEEAEDGRRRWATFFRTGSGRSAYWLTRREDGVTYQRNERQELGPVEDARITIYLTPEGSERVEVVDLPLADLPDSEEEEVLLADGSTAERSAWLESTSEGC